MRLSIATDAGAIHSLSLPASLDLASLRALVASELSMPADSVDLLHNGALLEGDAKTVTELGIVEDDILLVRASKRRTGPAGAGAGPSGDPFEATRQQLISDPRTMQQVARNNPALADAALNNPAEFARLLREQDRQRREEEARRQAQLNQLDNADPFDIESQRKIEEMIRQEQIQENMEHAIEHNPEAFGRVTMLYIDCEVNGHKVKAFVDSGAQATIISPDCAEACDIMRLLDNRFAGIARGVGTAKILGRIHSAPMKVGQHFLNCSFTVMEGKGVDLLFGLDMLKRHQATIDLKNNCLNMYDQSVPFLSEHELPEKARWETSGETPPDEEEGLPGGPSKASAAPTANQPAPAARPAAQPAPAPAPSDAANPEHVSTLMSLGATREEAVRALQAAGGNVDLAASFIF